MQTKPQLNTSQENCLKKQSDKRKSLMLVEGKDKFI